MLGKGSLSDVAYPCVRYLQGMTVVSQANIDRIQDNETLEKACETEP